MIYRFLKENGDEIKTVDQERGGGGAVPGMLQVGQSGQPDVPSIDLVDVYWTISGANAVVEVDRRRTCLAFVDGGSQPRTAVVIGAHQLTENYLVSSELRFSGSLLDQNKICSRT